jgi:multiple sugar transport system substrate-binding protein
MGNASNVEHFSDIIGLLMLQNGADLSDPTTKEAQEALQFYTNFMKVDKVWSDTLPSSTTAFARGEVAMMFAPSWRAHEILAINPNLQFGISSMPSLGSDKVAWASYWAEGVNSKSDNKDAAWKLLKYLSSKEVMQKLYSDQAETRTFGEPYSRVDLADSVATDPYVSTYLKDAPNASSWYLNSYTHDNGINDQMIKYYTDAVNAVLAGKTPAEARQAAGWLRAVVGSLALTIDLDSDGKISWIYVVSASRKLTALK